MPSMRRDDARRLRETPFFRRLLLAVYDGGQEHWLIRSQRKTRQKDDSSVFRCVEDFMGESLVNISKKLLRPLRFKCVCWTRRLYAVRVCRPGAAGGDGFREFGARGGALAPFSLAGGARPGLPIHYRTTFRRVARKCRFREERSTHR